jgi:hypothetical protein
VSDRSFLRHQAAYVALAVGCGSFTAALVRLVVGPGAARGESILAEKVEYLTQSERRIDLIAVGSSYTYRSFDPKSFDGELRTRGIETTSYNFAAPGTYGFEVHHYLVDLLSQLQPTQRPRTVAVELFPVDPPHVMTVMPQNHLTARAIEYHDLATTWVNVAALARAPMPWDERAAAGIEHLVHFAHRAGNVGAISTLGRTPKRRLLAATSTGGFNEELNGEHAHKTDYDVATHTKTLASLREELARAIQRGPALSASEDWFRREQVRQLRETGVDVLFVVPPMLWSVSASMHVACVSGSLPAPCVSLGDPDEYPALFAFDNRYDAGHLNDAGARLYSGALARKVADALH